MSEKHTCMKTIPIHNPHRKIDDATCWVEGQRLLHQSHSENMPKPTDTEHRQLKQADANYRHIYIHCPYLRIMSVQSIWVSADLYWFILICYVASIWQTPHESDVTNADIYIIIYKCPGLL